MAQEQTYLWPGKRFESFELAPGEDGSALMNKTKDHFTMGIQSFKMVWKAK